VGFAADKRSTPSLTKKKIMERSRPRLRAIIFVTSEEFDH